jgi:hypothetical protein
MTNWRPRGKLIGKVIMKTKIPDPLSKQVKEVAVKEKVSVDQIVSIALAQLKKSSALSQDGLLRLQIFLNDFYTIAGMGDADGVRLAQFVMHQQFANHHHLQIRFHHAPELTGFQEWWANAVRSYAFIHGPFCALISIKQVKLPLWSLVAGAAPLSITKPE